MKKRIIYCLLLIIALFMTIGCDKKYEVKDMKVIINEKEYILKTEKNETAKKLEDRLPQELTMKDLNQNEKYSYLGFDLPTNPENPKTIQRGDVMLYGRDCLVIFYDSFETTYSYTKIGHIDDLPYLEDETVTVKIEK